MSPEAKKRKLEPGAVEKSFMDEDLGSNFMDSSMQHDRVVVVEGQKFYVNSGILSYSSEFFNTLFNGPFAEKNQREIVLEEVTVSDFQNFLGAIYPAFFEINETNLECLMKLSARFLSPIVWKKCMKFLEPEEKFKQFDMSDLLKWSEASNSIEFLYKRLPRVYDDNKSMFGDVERIENYLIDTLGNKKKIISLKTVQLARDYNLEKVKEKIVMWLKNLLEGKAVSEGSFANATRTCVILANATSTRALVNMWKSAPVTLADDYKLLSAVYWKNSNLRELLKCMRANHLLYGEPSKEEFDFNLWSFVHQLARKDKTSELFTSVLQICEKYNLPKTAKYVTDKLAEDFKKDNLFTHIDVAVKFNLVPLKELMATYIRNNHTSLSEDSMKILSNTSLGATRFALEALIKKEIENPADVGPKK